MCDAKTMMLDSLMDGVHLLDQKGQIRCLILTHFKLSSNPCSINASRTETLTGVTPAMNSHFLVEV